MKKILLIIFLTIFPGACSQIEKRGYVFDLSNYQSIRAGVSSKDTVIELMGSPTFTSEINDQELWVYFSEDIKKFLFFKPQILKRQIMAISFDGTNIVSQINNYDLNDEQKNMQFAFDYTKVESNKRSLWWQIFGNIGQIGAK